MFSLIVLFLTIINLKECISAVPLCSADPSFSQWDYSVNLTGNGLYYMNWKITNSNSIDISLTANIPGTTWLGFGVSEVGHMVRILKTFQTIIF